MSEPDFLSSSRIAIIGLGSMGGSLAMALRGRCQALMGCDLDAETLSLAGELGLVDQISSNPIEILPAADVVILATPLGAILEANPTLRSEDVASGIFTTTEDLSAAYPAQAAREMGWDAVPMICSREIPVPGGLARCIRVLLQWNTDLP
jgi:monofunctional chorismate mutase